MSRETVTAFERSLSEWRDLINVFLKQNLPRIDSFPGCETLHEALRYAVDGGGKRIRPILVLAACETVGGQAQDCLPAACALELFHTYSLVHDDLPAMDDDDERRGRPTVHRQFDEATAILVGDVLLTLGFQWLVEHQTKLSSSDRVLQTIRKLVHALGAQGMVGGQYLDLTQSLVNAGDMQHMQDLKTGALLSVGCEIGALLGGGSEKDVDRLSQFGLHLGRVFQLVDDLLDKDQDTNGNTSMLNHLSEDDVWQRAQALNERACALLDPFEARAMWLKSLANQLLFRKN